MRGWILTWMDIHGMPIFSRSDSFLIILAEKVKQCRTIAGKRESLGTHFFGYMYGRNIELMPLLLSDLTY
jgi:hypothetical protein